MDISLSDIKKCVVNAIIKKADIEPEFLQVYVNGYDVNFDIDLDDMLRDFKTDIDTFIDDNVYGIEDYQKDLKAEKEYT